ncbi:class I SAM-dependent DNA methyltransferase [Tellurirhabdus rosea]|uniref:class I SAM-dependent DNA methyltransferase n=1 Tax=Tellurirhabdus rosea TaxID=2674997 RepID=UPI0022597250|nr:class I SAM-dependent methyltransferase [Tellurirhabdus rosea]
MIGKHDEYEKMFRLEQRLWWYRILHGRVLQAIEARFGSRRDLRILDAGCGTGGMLSSLTEAGYTDLRGVDGSADAVDFSRQRGLNVSLLNLNDFGGYAPGETYDVIVCNDVFCYFDDAGLRTLLREMRKRLAPGGVLISNNNAFNVFRGSHDQAVGSQRRFVRADFERFAPEAGLRIAHSTYWSLALAPLILAIRLWQSFQLKVGLQSPDQPASDVYFPGNIINETLYRIVKTEQTVLPRTPFGSSLFMVLSRSNAD